MTIKYLLILLYINIVISDHGISRHQLDNWASKFGGPLFEFARSVTKYNEILARFQTTSDSKTSPSVEPIRLDILLAEISSELNSYFDDKIAAITKTSSWAEQRANEYNTDDNNQSPDPPNYISAKRLRNYLENGLSQDDNWPWPIHLETHIERHFSRQPVNLSMSTVHVPTNVYEKDPRLLAGIDWSSDMDTNFIANYKEHPTLSWQYFCSVTGFMRRYPGSPWPTPTTPSSPDLFDCRIRPWYLTSSNSPKTIIILLDVSGSMTGSRSEIAQHVVEAILDTLTENDYVNVLHFSESVKVVSECFYGDDVVQATPNIIRTLKQSLGSQKPEQIAKFPDAINKAFDILQNYPTSCNRAIFIITDGSPYNYNEIFQSRQNPMHPIRVFTYLIGKDSGGTDGRNLQKMACTNRGYFVHVQTLGEGREQVLKYLPVMSRPLVINGSHYISWSGVYADMVDLRQESDWAWARVMATEQKQKVLLATRDDDYYTPPSPSSPSPSTTPTTQYNFIISASIPVYDLRNTTTNNARLANFLGVVGTDIQLTELQRLMNPFKLGVNGYGFLITNNGRIVMHPKWKPILKTTNGYLLKPNYNSIDISEIELIDSNGTFRNNDSGLLEMRNEMLIGEHSYRPELRVKLEADDFSRILLRTQRYEYINIKNTPYTLILTVPTTLNHYTAKIDVLRVSHDGELDLTTLFDSNEDRNWSLNPNWIYCEYLRSDYIQLFGSKEDELIHFLRRMRSARNSWPWRNTGEGISRRHGHGGGGGGGSGGYGEFGGGSGGGGGGGEDVYRCDRDLIQALVFDANATEIFTSTKPLKFNKYESSLAKLFALMPREIITMHGALLAFIMTRSGLTRWIELGNNQHLKSPPTKLATDSILYQRAVDRYFIDPNSFIFSLNKEVTSQRVVTATRALFVRKNGRSAPVSVVGIQFDHGKWAGRFFDIAETCIEGRSCAHTCASEEYDCFVLDDNGFILITEIEEDTGKFFGQVNGMVMEMLVNSDVYRKIKITDYQSVCYEPIEKTSNAQFLSTPFKQIKSWLNWFKMKLVFVIFELIWNPVLVVEGLTSQSQYDHDSDNPNLHLQLNKTRLRPCDIEYDLYTYGPSYNTYNFSYHGLLTKCAHNCDGYFNVHYIPRTNLILVVTDGKCRCGHSNNSSSINGIEIEYNNHVNGQRCPQQQELRRKKLEMCIDSNPEEKAMREDCGQGTIIQINLLLIIVLTSL